MKEVLFVICSLVILFPSCSQDEMTELQPNSTETKIKAYKEYAEKLADKYGVNMQLNENNMEEIVKNLTFEQMEEDFASIANMQIVAPKKKKLGIRRKVSLTEGDGTTRIYKDIYASFGRDNQTRQGYGSVTVTWNYLRDGHSYADVDFSFNTSLSTYSTTTLGRTLRDCDRFAFETDPGDVYPFYSNFYTYYAHCYIKYDKYAQIETVRIYR